MKKTFTLLGGGYFEAGDRALLQEELMALEVRAREAGGRCQTDLNLYEQPIPRLMSPIFPICRAYWEDFDSEGGYYQALAQGSDLVRVVARSRAPEHIQRVNVISDLCAVVGTALEVRLI